MTRFPCHLGDIRTPLDNAPRCHLIAETGGMRFYIGTFATVQEANSDAMALVVKPGKSVAFYVLDRAANHFISDGRKAFEREFCK